MKEQFKAKLLLALLAIVLFSACALAQQSKDIKVDLSVTVDKEVIYDNNYKVSITNMDTKVVDVFNTSSNIILNLKYNTRYQISVSRMNTNTKSIIIDTNAPIDNWYIISGIMLTEYSSQNIIAGGIKYNNKLKTFQAYKL